KPPQDSPLARWSRLKREAAREKGRATAQTAAAARSVVASAGPATSPAASVATLSGTAPPVSLGVSPPVTREVDGSAPRSDELPPVESLTFDSDFAPYFQPQVDAVLKPQGVE